jgi:hypothetical protein
VATRVRLDLTNGNASWFGRNSNLRMVSKETVALRRPCNCEAYVRGLIHEKRSQCRACNEAIWYDRRLRVRPAELLPVGLSGCVVLNRQCGESISQTGRRRFFRREVPARLNYKQRPWLKLYISQNVPRESGVG